MKKLLDLLMHVYYRTADPALVRLRKRARLRLWQAPQPLPELPLRLLAAQAADDGAAAQALRRMTRVAARYDMRRPGETSRAAARRATPMMLDLSACSDAQGLQRLMRAHSSRTASKIRRAQRLGYRVRPFALPNHVHDVHAVKTSMPMRSGGPVLAHWLLKPEHLARPAQSPQPLRPPACPTHWTIWWGVFMDEPGHRDGALATGERLVAYVKLARCGDIVHYLDLMGHRDHLQHGVMLLMHAHIANWLLESREETHAQGARAIWYGALEHGGTGLLTWKKRAGFAPVRVRLDAQRD
ncbi:hypothetical protein [Bordetella genomosp. 13]|uniref:hypothetical protein n=1 Tax=Bordetella genomosp. 13 TaxID=463040 RepID=UPI0011A01599|nr:hypothetical protein [Bordetella genomosp. 13]